ncbi:uncharacterized protein BDW70DRAFT_135493 [Aspergillus foveolatus]|uniref:uncharacterized protein n=1 Tax=Aspergillus foveolatus TaxID=210207 RepID=UPI003CCCE070
MIVDYHYSLFSLALSSSEGLSPGLIRMLGRVTGFFCLLYTIHCYALFYDTDAFSMLENAIVLNTISPQSTT